MVQNVQTNGVWICWEMSELRTRTRHPNKKRKCHPHLICISECVCHLLTPDLCRARAQPVRIYLTSPGCGCRKWFATQSLSLNMALASVGRHVYPGCVLQTLKQCVWGLRCGWVIIWSFYFFLKSEIIKWISGMLTWRWWEFLFLVYHKPKSMKVI